LKEKMSERSRKLKIKKKKIQKRKWQEEKKEKRKEGRKATDLLKNLGKGSPEGTIFS